MGKISEFLRRNAHWVVVFGAILICVLFVVFSHPSGNGEYRTLDGKDAYIYESTEKTVEEVRAAIIKYAEQSVPAVVENADGTTSTIDAPTVESIDENNPYLVANDYCPDGKECGLGAYIYAPTESYEAFKNYTIGKCWDVDGYYGAQCWDLSSLHSMNYTKDKRVFSTCGTGAARGMWQCRDQNAGDEYELVYDKTTLRAGDIVVTNGGTWGHTCIAAGPYSNGYVACLGENQGGSACPGGGAATNIINLSMNDFLGAFRPKTYTHAPTPTPPTPTPTPVADCSRWDLKWGDTLGEIMLACEGKIEWGEAMREYAKTWVDETTGNTVFYGWSHGTGVGLFAGHTIVRNL